MKKTAVLAVGGLALMVAFMVGSYDKRKAQLASLQSQLNTLQTQLNQLKATFTSDQNQLQQQQTLQAQITGLQQQVAAEIQKDQQATSLLQQAQQQQQQIQSLQAQISQLMVAIQQAALTQGPASDANPDGYNQAQLAYLQSHSNLLPSGQIIAAQGGKLMIDASGTDGGPIVPNIIGANPTYGDPGFIVGDHWYPNIQQAQAASQSTGMPWNAAEIVNPSQFKQYETPINNNQNQNSGSHVDPNYSTSTYHDTNGAGMTYNPYSTSTPTNAAQTYTGTNVVGTTSTYQQQPDGTYKIISSSNPGSVGMTLNYGQVMANLQTNVSVNSYSSNSGSNRDKNNNNSSNSSSNSGSTNNSGSNNNNSNTVSAAGMTEKQFNDAIAAGKTVVFG